MHILSLLAKWWRTWGTLPIYSWVKAAALYRKGQFAAAEKFYRSGLDRHANHPASFCARIDLAYCQFKLGRLDDAEQELRAVSTQLPQSREAYLRMAKLQMWRGQSLEAAWTIRRALRNVPVDPEFAALYLISALDSGAPGYLLNEALQVSQNIESDDKSSLRLQAARARAIMNTKLPSEEAYQTARTKLAQLAAAENAPFETIIMFSEVLIAEGKIAHARRLLRRALQSAADYPRILSLLAETYLKSGPFYNAEYAKQLATTACQNTTWASPREMHILAESYYHVGDKVSALIIASKAKELGSKLLGTYRDTKTLDRLIESLSSGTQA
ncbi:MAG: tetratricopeptide repeat protein [Deltaproteobacteria bacterium]|nr:tetratricopeptide repeat protein [Deltaproteobacteria bacterium]